MSYPQIILGMSTADVKAIISQVSGWSVHVGTQHTLASPQTIAQGTTAILSNNSTTTIDSQRPYDTIAPLWEVATSKFRPINLNDYYSFIVRFKAKNTQTTGAYMTVGIDIGGTFGIIFERSELFIKGADVEQVFNIEMSGYSGATFMANGGIPKLTSNAGITTVYDKEYHIVRHHAGR